MQPAIAQQTSKKGLEGTFEKHTVSKKFVPEGDNTPHHIGVVPCAIVPDNLQAAVTKARVTSVRSMRPLQTLQMIMVLLSSGKSLSSAG
jgi:hypothetical protein